jgi:hypothetical protein
VRADLRSRCFIRVIFLFDVCSIADAVGAATRRSNRDG